MRTVRRRGFTLVEVLVVMVILVLLFSIVGPRILGSQQKANIKKAQIDIGSIGGALELYALDNRGFPNTEEGLEALMEAPADEQRTRNWDGPYMDAEDLPIDPWGNEYRYIYPNEHGRRDFPNIWSPGKDSEDSTDDDIVNWKQQGELPSEPLASNDD